MSTASQIQDTVHSWISSACRRDEPLQPRTHARPDQRQLNTLHRLYQIGGPDLPSKTQSVAAVYFPVFWGDFALQLVISLLLPVWKLNVLQMIPIHV